MSHPKNTTVCLPRPVIITNICTDSMLKWRCSNTGLIMHIYEGAAFVFQDETLNKILTGEMKTTGSRELSTHGPFNGKTCCLLYLYCIWVIL